MNLQGDGILSVCLKCRLDKQSPVKEQDRVSNADTVAVGQLHEMVMTLCTTVKSLSEKLPKFIVQGQYQNVTSISDHSTMQGHSQNVMSISDPGSRLVIREEIREIHDRERRKHSIIVRGFPHSTVNDVNERFKDISKYLINQEISMSDVICVNQDRGIFRGKIVDPQIRRSLLLEARRLKESTNFRSVYLHKDLTYKQREELRSRCAGLRRPVVGQSEEAPVVPGQLDPPADPLD